VKIIINKQKLDKGLVKIVFPLLILMFILMSFSLLQTSFSTDVTSVVSNTSSNATIEKSVAISRSNNLTDGIPFGIVTAGNNRNATGNWNSTNNTQYWISLDSTTNVPVDLCILANDTLKSGSFTIANTNYHYSNSTTNNVTLPTYPAAVDITTSYVHAADDVDMTGSTYYVYFRFSLDVPAGTHGGTYSNTISFKATENITAC
jgi:hypothetical protein